MQMLAKIATDVGDSKEMEDIRDAINKVKVAQDYEENFKALNLTTEVLRRTYAYLMNKDIKDEEVVKLLKDGLRIEILRRLVIMMPEQCKTCQQMVTWGREETPLVTCRLCRAGACPTCYPQVLNLGWRYLCGPCDGSVASQHEVLAKHLESKYRKKKERTASRVPVPNVITLDEGEGEQEQEEQDEKEEEEEEEEQEEVHSLP